MAEIVAVGHAIPADTDGAEQPNRPANDFQLSKSKYAPAPSVPKIRFPASGEPLPLQVY
jgi:hypothetical protein